MPARKNILGTGTQLFYSNSQSITLERLYWPFVDVTCVVLTRG